MPAVQPNRHPVVPSPEGSKCEDTLHRVPGESLGGTRSGLAIQLLRGSAALLFWVILSGTAIMMEQPSATRPTGQVVTGFSWTRAMADIRALAAEPHPIGSEALIRAHGYIVAQLREIQGAKLNEQIAPVIYRAGNVVIGATTHNIAARLYGKHNTRAILLTAHYDSAPNSYGAADDASGVAVVLETLRQLSASGRLRNDVVVLFSDGEEAGLLGARAFLEGHAWAKDVGLVVNFEARGSGGPPLMFETSARNGWLIHQLAVSGAAPRASSLMYEVYKLLPAATDLSVYKQARLSALNFAFIHRSINYHSWLDNTNNISAKSVQDEGDSALRIARYFGDLDLNNPIQSTDVVYFNGPMRSLLIYSAALGKILALSVAILLIVLIVAGLKRGNFRLGRMAAGFFGLLGAIVLSVIIVKFLLLIGGARVQGQRFLLISQQGWFLLAFVLLAISITAAVAGLLNRSRNSPEVPLGMLLPCLVLALVTSHSLAGVSYLFLLPALVALIPRIIAICSAKLHPGFYFLMCGIAVTLILLFLSPIMAYLLDGTGLGMASVTIALVVMLAGSILPLLLELTQASGWAAAMISALAFLGAIGIAFTHLQPGPTQPTRDSLFFIFDQDTGKAVWASADQAPDQWTRRFLTDNPQNGNLKNYLPIHEGPLLIADAQGPTLPPPRATVVTDHKEQQRDLTLHIDVPPGAAAIRVFIDHGSQVSGAAIDGVPAPSVAFPTGNNELWSLEYWGVPNTGINLALSLKSPQPIHMRLVSQSYGLPKNPGSAGNRPASIIPSPFRFTDTTQSIKIVTF